jgi:hypothetical protein
VNAKNSHRESAVNRSGHSHEDVRTYEQSGPRYGARRPGRLGSPSPVRTVTPVCHPTPATSSNRLGTDGAAGQRRAEKTVCRSVRGRHPAAGHEPKSTKPRRYGSSRGDRYQSPSNSRRMRFSGFGWTQSLLSARLCVPWDLLASEPTVRNPARRCDVPGSCPARGGVIVFFNSGFQNWDIKREIAA